MIHDVVDAVATGILVLGTAVWLGGFVTLVIVSRVASATLQAADRVAFFRRLGRVFGIVAASALVLAFAGGATLLRDRVWSGMIAAAAAVAVSLVVVTGVGVGQARAMTRARRAALDRPGDAELARQIDRGARRAVALRGLIGALTVALVTLGIVLAHG